MKIKRLLLVLPVIFTLVLSLSCGLVVYADSVQDSPYTGELSALSCNEQITGYETLINQISADYKEQYKSYIESGTMPDYFGMNYFYGTKILNYTSSDNYSGIINFYDFQSSDFLYENDDVIFYSPSLIFSYLFKVENGEFSGNNKASSPPYAPVRDQYFIYNKQNGFYTNIPTSYGTDYEFLSSYAVSNALSYPYIPIYVETNLPNFPFADGVEHGGLNVKVTFNPALSGTIDRKMNVNGSDFYSSGFTMSVQNNSSKAIQFRMAILPGGQTEIKNSAPNSSSSTDTIFYYYSNEWVYDRSLDAELDYSNNKFNKYQKSSCWHYVKSGSTFTQVFKWSQIPIKDNTSYTVVVQAIATDYDIATQIFTTTESDGQAYPEYKQLLYNDCKYVYTSEFKVSYLGDVQYDPNDKSNGIVPYSGNNDFQRYAYSYNAKENEDGSINYDNVNLYDDSSSWVHKGILGGSSNNYYSHNADYSFDNFLSSSRSYLSFLNSAFDFFPDWIWGTISVGFFTIIIIGIVKRLG